MCGIAGILAADPARISAERLQKMTNALAHRGPDGEQVWISTSGVAGLGHRRLPIIDLSPAGVQPMHYLDRYSIVHNGELYNYLELRSLLQEKGYSFVSRTDTEVILAAYDHFGNACLQHFDGMFAFAIWDEKEKSLFLARDRFGEKPLFFYRDDDELVFASELKALWAAGIRKERNPKMLFNFLTLGYTQNPANGYETFFQNILKLPARSFLYYYPLTGETEVTFYWDLDVTQMPAIDEAEAIATFRSLLDTSVSRRLRSDVRVGASVSGGLDSSTIVAGILQQTDAPSPLPAFSAVFPGFDKDESAYIEMLSRQFQLESFRTTPTAADLISDLERLAYHQEEPFSSSSVYAQFRVFGLAAANAVKVMLDGQGADEQLAGYHKYYKWYWQELYRGDKKALARELEAAKGLGIDEPWTWKNRLAAHLPDYAGLFLKKQRAAQQRYGSDLSPDFIRQWGVSYYELPHIHRLNGVLYYNTLLSGLEELLRYADRNSMAHGVEVRLPFLSHELVSFVFSLPTHFKIREGWTKWLLRRSMAEVLPSAIVWRRDKTGYEPPQRAWMQEPVVQDYIHEARRSLVKAGVLAPRVLQKKIQPRDANAAENSDWRYMVTAACAM